MKTIKAAVAAMAFAASCSANANLLINGGFEAPAAGPGAYVIMSSIPGWVGAPTIEVQNHVAGSPSEGMQLVELDTNSNSSMYQDFVTTAGTYYTIHFDYSPRPGIAASSNVIQFSFNDVVYATLAQSGIGNADTVWTGYDFTILATGAMSRIAFAALGTSDSYGGYLDNVIATAVPEPESVLLLGLGLVLVAGARRRGRA